MDTHHATFLYKHEYVPHIKKLSSNAEINKQHVKVKQSDYRAEHKNPITNKMPPPFTHQIKTPTLNSTQQNNPYMSNTIHDTSCRDEESKLWQRI